MDEGSQTLPHPASRSTPNTRKWLRELTVITEESAVKKPKGKRPKALNKEEEWVEVPKRRTSGKRKGRSLSKRRKNHTVCAQKRCSSNQRRG